MATVTYEAIATQTLGSDTASITFSSIASTWTDIRLIAAVIPQGSDPTFALRFNGDTGSNYSYTDIRGSGSSASSTRNSNLTYLYLEGVTNPTGTPSLYDVNLFGYAGSTYKTILSRKNNENYVTALAGLWRSTSAINEIQFSADRFNAAGRLGAGSVFTLYGIKAE